VVERVELKIDEVYQVKYSLHHRKSNISTVSISSLRLTVRATTDVTGDTAECCSVSEISI